MMETSPSPVIVVSKSRILTAIHWTAFPATSVCSVKTLYQPQYVNMKHMDHEACHIGVAAAGVLVGVRKKKRPAKW